ncbi:hypothetical protein RI367_001151 [Sorochytrium milnesiophthora]
MAATAAERSGTHTLLVEDNRTGQKIELPVTNGTVPSNRLAKLGLSIYDNGYLNTAVCKSSISYIDGDKGILRYRGIPIEELAENSSFLEVAFLLIYGELPDAEQLKVWTTKVMRHTFIHENLTEYLKAFRYDAHPMGMLVSSVAALSTFHPEASTDLQGEHLYTSESVVNKQILRLLGKMPTIAACAYRHRIGRPYNDPSNELGYTENFLYMLDRLSESDYKPNPVEPRPWLPESLGEADRSTAAMRQISSTGIDPYIGVSGGANEAALRMLEEIGSVENIPPFLEQVKAKKRRLMGFGHRVYKSYDPRAKILKKIADEVFEVMGRDSLIDVACELERIALSDEYFIKRNLYPNVDFYSGIIYKAMGFPTDMFPVLFCIARTAGWLAHWREQLRDPEIKIFRPRQVYDGEDPRPYADMDKRAEVSPLVNAPYAADRNIRKKFAQRH